MTDTTESSGFSLFGVSLKMILTGAALVIATVVGTLLVLQFAASERERELKQWQVRLGIVADSRLADVEGWLGGQLDELTALAENASLQLYMTILDEDDDSSADDAEASFLATLLTAVSERAGFAPQFDQAEVSANVSRVGVAGIALIDRNGEVVVASPEMPPVAGILRSFIEDTPKGERAISDIYLGSGGKPTMSFAVPVFAIQGDESAASQIGVVVGVKEISAELYPLLKQPGNTDATSEAVLVRKSGATIEYISPLSDGTAALKRKLSVDTPDLAAMFAINTPGGFGTFRDYLDQEVLVTSRAISTAPWSLLYKINTSEALVESERRLTQMMVAFFLIIGLVLAAMIALWFFGTSTRAKESADKFEQLANRFQGQRNFMHLVTDSQPNAIIILDDHARYRWFNQVALDMSGLERGDLFNKTVTAVLGPIEGKRVDAWVKECLEKSERLSVTHEMEVPDKGSVIFRSDLIPLEAREEMPPGVLMVSQDISETIKERQQRERIMRQLVSTLVSVVDRRDPYSANHSIHVGQVAHAVAEEMGLEDSLVEAVEIAGNLMNLGKISVPEDVLTKTERLTEEEVVMIRDSVLTSADLIKSIEFDGPVEETLRQLLENYDGSGVPNGLKGEDIAITARVVAAANSFVGMVSARSWRPGMDIDDAVNTLMKESGQKFDRRAISALANYIDNRQGREEWQSFGEAPSQ